MGDQDITVRSATDADTEELSAVLARAFDDDPVWLWMLPTVISRQRRLRRIHTTILRHDALRHGGVEVACEKDESSGTGHISHIAGAAIWLSPGHAFPSQAQQLLALPGFARAFGRSIPLAGAYERSCVNSHPREPHWYLYILGTEPDLQGRGIGAALLRSRLARVDDSGLPAYLECSKASNIALYEHFGFVATGTLTLPKGAPTITTMWRPPTQPRPT